MIVSLWLQGRYITPVYNNDDILFFRVSTSAKPSCNNVLQSSPLRESGCNTILHSDLANIDTWNRVFYLLIDSHLRVLLLHKMILLPFSWRAKLEGNFKTHTNSNVKLILLITVLLINCVLFTVKRWLQVPGPMSMTTDILRFIFTSF